MEITRIEFLARRDRARIYVDGEEEPRVEVATDLVVDRGLAAGDSLTPAQIRDLESDDGVFRAREAALNLLAHRPRARAELRRRLSRKDFSEEVTRETLRWLEERGYVDDEAFAESFIRDRIRLKPRGRFGLLQELGRKGVDRGLAEEVVDRVLGEEKVDEAALARDAAAAWARRNRRALARAGTDREAGQKARRRLYGHLARRGFSPDAIRQGLATVLDD